MSALSVTTAPPWGCPPSMSPQYYRLCDLGLQWGIVVEALAAAGAVTAFILLVVLLSSLPFVEVGERRGTIGPQAGILTCTLGLFGLAVVFVVNVDFATCVLRRFLFGVLFAGCFGCLLVQGVWLYALAHRDRSLSGLALCLGSLALWLVEVIINTEWLLLTVVRYPQSSEAPIVPCSIINTDFVLALVYVMVLLAGVVVVGVAAVTGHNKRWRQESVYLLLTSLLSIATWAAWISMYLYTGINPSWNEPTIAIALVCNAWIFLIFFSIPELYILTEKSETKTIFRGDLFVNTDAVIEEQKEATSNIYVENTELTTDKSGSKKLVSPYGDYNGHLRGCVYQPTELALISSCLPMVGKNSIYGIPRPSMIRPFPGSHASTPPSDCTTPKSIGNGSQYRHQ